MINQNSDRLLSVLSFSANSVAEEPVEISVMIFDRGRIPEQHQSVTDNRWTNWINEQMAHENIRISFTPIARAEEMTRIPILMATRTAPDLLMTYNHAMVLSFYQAGQIHKLNDLLHEYGQDLMVYVGDECLDAGLDKQGNIFAVPARRSTQANFNLFIRNDWLKALDIPVPRTVTELYDTLYAFRNEDPGKIGDNKLIPASIPLSSVLFFKSFINIQDVNAYLANSVGDMAGHCYADPASGLAYFKFMNSLYQQDLIDREFFIRSDFGFSAEDFAMSGRLGFWEHNVNANVDSLRGEIQQNLIKIVEDAELVSIPPIQNIWDNKIYNPMYPKHGAFLFIPSTAEHPEAVMKYLNFQAGYGGFTLYHGFENEHYQLENGLPIVIDSPYNAQDKDWIRHDLFVIGNMGYFTDESDFMTVTASEMPEWRSYIIDNFTHATMGHHLPMTSYISETEARQSENIQKIFDDYSVTLTICEPNMIEYYYEELITELRRYDMDKILDERYAYYVNQ